MKDTKIEWADHTVNFLSLADEIALAESIGVMREITKRNEEILQLKSHTTASVGERIRFVREAHSVSLEDLAAVTGISKATISNVERGCRKVSTVLAALIARSLLEHVWEIKRGKQDSNDPAMARREPAPLPEKP